MRSVHYWRQIKLSLIDRCVYLPSLGSRPTVFSRVIVYVLQIFAVLILQNVYYNMRKHGRPGTEANTFLFQELYNVAFGARLCKVSCL